MIIVMISVFLQLMMVLFSRRDGEGGDDNANKETASAGDADAEESLHYKRPVSCPNNNS